jgi:hypothetical protein
LKLSNLLILQISSIGGSPTNQKTSLPIQETPLQYKVSKELKNRLEDQSEKVGPNPIIESRLRTNVRKISNLLKVIFLGIIGVM